MAYQLNGITAQVYILASETQSAEAMLMALAKYIKSKKK